MTSAVFNSMRLAVACSKYLTWWDTESEKRREAVIARKMRDTRWFFGLGGNYTRQEAIDILSGGSAVAGYTDYLDYTYPMGTMNDGRQVVKRLMSLAKRVPTVTVSAEDAYILRDFL